jgi:rare lipoprotein A (peptidoglycan hydrolase)
MKRSNNKRYLGQIVVGCAVLCLSLVAGAQETVAPQVESPQKESLKKEEIKIEEVQTDEAQKEAVKEGVIGIASYYASKFNGRRTASGEKFSQKVLTAAHLTLPFGTLLKVTNLQNLKSVIVRVNDRGPHVRGRIVDLSRAAAELIGMRHTGTARVELEILAK